MRRGRSTNGDIKLIPMLQRRKAMTESAHSFADVADDARVSETPLVDKGFASVRKIGNGLYATISDLSKGTRPCVTAAFWWVGMRHSWWKDSRHRQWRALP